MPEQFTSPYASQFAATYHVNTAHDLFSWTETNTITPDAEWPGDVYQNTGDPAEDTFIVAVPTPDGLVGFFAATAEDAERIRQSIF